MHPVHALRLYICQGVDVLPDGDQFRSFLPDVLIQYHPLCDDFGPMNMSSVIRFVEQLDDELHQSCTLLYSVDESKRSLTNAIFLLGAYMILRLGTSADEVDRTFAWAGPAMVEAYRDATFAAPDFDLALTDCWRGLIKGTQLGWVGLPSSEEAFRWGEIDVDEYENYDSPLNGDLHEVVPGKFVTFKGPVDLGGSAYADDEHGFRSFSPDYCADVLADMNIDGGGPAQRKVLRRGAVRGAGYRDACAGVR